MKWLVVLAAMGALSPAGAARAQTQPAPQRSTQTASSSEKTAEAYAQFLIGHRLAESDDEAGAIAAYKRAMELDPFASDIPAELAGLYLQANKIQEAMGAAQQALKVSPTNREANRVLGIVYAAMSETGRGSQTPNAPPDKASSEYATKAVEHLERALERPIGEPDPNTRATLSRLYLRTGAYDKAVRLLTDLVEQEPGWADGPVLLAEAFAGAGRTTEAIAWLEAQAPSNPRLFPALGDFYERERRWSDAASAYSRAVQRSPRNLDLKLRYAQMLLNAGGRDNAGTARDALTDVVAARATDPFALYLLSQAQRRAGDAQAAEVTARRVIAQNNRSPRGYFALAEALEERHQYQAIVDELAPVIARNRGKSGDGAFDVSLLLPHLGFAYQELGDHEKAIATFEEGRRLSPKDPAAASYLIEANIAAKKYAAALDVARAAVAEHPGDLRLTRLQAQALRRSGKADQGITLLEAAVNTHADEPSAYIALAQLYADADRGDQAVKTLQMAQAKFPADNGIAFELGTVFDKQKKFSDAEAAFRQVLAREPENAAALNYLGYMLAERGERLDESVGYLKKALQIEPENGSYLDSLGWAYFKSDRLDLAEENLRRAADQLKTNSVIQEHYGQVLFKLQRYDDAIAAWTRALAGDGDSIDRSDIDRKIRAAKQKIQKK
jgi:tetratricopeptide (TPR) repeat protein